MMQKLVLIWCLQYLTNAKILIQETFSLTHNSYKNTDLDVNPVRIHTSSNLAQCNIACSKLSTCRSWTIIANRHCRLYDTDLCTDQSLTLKDLDGARYYEVRRRSTRNQNISLQVCLGICMDNKKNCKTCGKDNGFFGRYCDKSCPENWRYNPSSDKCYATTKNPVESYQQAGDSCVTVGGVLATDQDQQVHDFYVNAYSSTNRKFFIDLTDAEKEGEWKHGSGEEVDNGTWSAWAKEEPKGEDTDCVVMDENYFPGFTFVDCSTKAVGALCETSQDSDCEKTGSCYTIVTGSMDAEEAEIQCQRRGGTLMDVPNVEMYNQISEWNRDEQPFTKADNLYHYIGLRRIASTADRLERSDGSDNTFVPSYTQAWFNETWLKPEMSNTQGDCVAIVRVPSFYWIDVSCESLHPYACQQEPDSAMMAYQSEPEPTATNECPEGYTQAQDSCFWLSQTTATYLNAEKACAQDGGRLSTMKTEEIKTLFQWMSYHKHPSDQRSLFFGLTDRQHEKRFVWSDGDSLAPTDPMYKYSFPMSRPLGHYLHCTIMDSDQDMKWFTIPCNVQDPSTGSAIDPRTDVYPLCQTAAEYHEKVQKNGTKLCH